MISMDSKLFKSIIFQGQFYAKDYGNFKYHIFRGLWMVWISSSRYDNRRILQTNLFTDMSKIDVSHNYQYLYFKSNFKFGLYISMPSKYSVLFGIVKIFNINWYLWRYGQITLQDKTLTWLAIRLFFCICQFIGYFIFDILELHNISQWSKRTENSTYLQLPLKKRI